MGDNKQLVWYDALTTVNEVYYQNGLNLSNLPFAKACGNILTNYCWSGSQAMQSKRVAMNEDFESRNIFFGIDVWAQNGTWYSHPRTTWGGGGTNTGVAAAKLAQVRLSAGVFAPAWSFEHFPSHGRDIEETMWEGKALPADLTCSCGNALSRHQQDEGFALAYHARRFPAGSGDFFYTDMARVFGVHRVEEGRNLYNNRQLHSQLGSQSILPLFVSREDSRPRSHFSHRFEESCGQAKLIIDCHNGLTTENPTNQPFKRWITLYQVNMPANGSLAIKIVCRNLLPSDCDAIPSIYLGETNSTFSVTGTNPQMIEFKARGLHTRTGRFLTFWCRQMGWILVECMH